jgi:carboxyl-terminal processing protease
MRGISRLVHHRRRFGLFVACTLLVVVSAGWLAVPATPLEGPGRNDRQVAFIVSSLMRDQHLSQHELDDEISRRAAKQFLDSFDGRKLYFYKSDIDEFMERRDQLDDDVRKGRVDFAHTVFKRYLERLEERVALVDELLDREFDFSVDETLTTDAEDLTNPADAAEAHERWRKMIKYNLLTLRADDVEMDEARAKIRRRYDTLAKRWRQTDSDELLERFLTAVTSSFDPHTTYMSPSTLTNFRILMRLNLEGIGAALQISDEGFTTVTKIIPGGAADKHGKLKPEDRIVSVGQGEDGEMDDVVDMKLNDVVKRIRGTAGTIVRLGVQPTGGGETKIYNIVRAKIQLEDSAARSAILERGQQADNTPLKIGVIDLPSFYMDMEAARDDGGRGEFRSTTRDVRKILEDFKSKNVDAVILDLRRNGGGSLTEAINLTGLFIDQGPVVQVKDSEGRVQSYNDLDRGMAWSGALVVLTSKFSASASEILAGAIQDYHRGLVIGDESTHGKGTVQSLLDLGSKLFPIPNPPNLGALKITMQQFYRPNGDSTQRRGVLPDVVLPSLSNHIGMGEADLDFAVDFDRVAPARYAEHNLVQTDWITRMRNRSKSRVGDSDEFAKELKRIERYKRLKDEKVISLNEEKYIARRDAERDAEEEEEKHLEEQVGAVENEVFADDFYNREIMSITIDYITELANNKVAAR